jgi:hypothetical protein
VLARDAHEQTELMGAEIEAAEEQGVVEDHLRALQRMGDEEVGGIRCRERSGWW